VTRLEGAETQLEDLKLQLDDAMGAEDMLEQLTERNLTLTEVRSDLDSLCWLSFKRLTQWGGALQKLEEMQAAVEDLEALKELNDELEENHVETENQLKEEIGKCSSTRDFGMGAVLLTDIVRSIRLQGLSTQGDQETGRRARGKHGRL
jgi:dynactin 1